MERPRRRPEPAAIDISWVSCRGVRSTLPFHTPCLYASVFVAPSSARGVHGHRRPHRVKTPTDRAGGANPEWDAPLRLYLPADASLPSPPPTEAGKDDSKDGGDDDDVLLLRFELKAEVAVLGDKLAACAAVPVPGLVADGRTRRVSYQLAGPDGKQPNGVISFSYAFRCQSNGGDDVDVATPPSPATPTTPTAHSPPAPPTAAPPRLYPAIDQWWPLEAEQIPIYPPVTVAEAAATLASSPYYPPPPPATRLEPPVSVYPPSPETTTTTSSPCGVYPPAGEAVAASGMYPTVDLAPVSCWYPPAAPALYGVERGYAVAPGWDDRRLYS